MSTTAISVAAQVAGLQRAVARLEQASAALDPVDTFIPLFETLNWVASIDQRIGLIWYPHGERLKTAWRDEVEHGPQIAAVAWARNVVHHQWADALTLDPFGHGLYPSPDLYPSANLYPQVDHAWLWRPGSQLPAAAARSKKQTPGPDGPSSYEAYLAGQPAARTLSQMLPSFEFVLTLLEPRRAR